MLKRMFRLAAMLAVVTHVSCAGAQYIPGVTPAAAVGAIAKGGYVGGYAGGAVVTLAVIGLLVAEGVRDYRRESDGMRTPWYFQAPEPDPTRRISVQDCTKPVDLTAGNLMCRVAE